MTAPSSFSLGKRDKRSSMSFALGVWGDGNVVQEQSTAFGIFQHQDACKRNVGAHLGLTPARYQSGETALLDACGRSTRTTFQHPEWSSHPQAETPITPSVREVLVVDQGFASLRINIWMMARYGHGGGRVDQPFEVFGEPAIAAEPSERTLDHPAPWQQMEPRRPRAGA